MIQGWTIDSLCLTVAPPTCVMTHYSHGWCEGGATALNVVTTGDLGVWRRVSQAPGSAVAQLPVNYLAQPAGSLSARRAEEEDKACSPFRRVCVSSGWLGLQWNICHIPLGFEARVTPACAASGPAAITHAATWRQLVRNTACSEIAAQHAC